MSATAHRWAKRLVVLHALVVFAIIARLLPAAATSGPPFWLALLLPFSLAHAVDRWGGKRAAVLFLLTYLITATGEAWGTQVGLFGARYQYLTAAWAPLPGTLLLLVVPCMWFMMMVPSFAIARLVTARDASPLVVASVGATIMTAWDAVLDPVSVGAGLWRWQSGHLLGGAIPVENYLSWWLGSAIVIALYAYAERRAQRPEARTVTPLGAYAATALAYLCSVPPALRVTVAATMGAVAVVGLALVYRRSLARHTHLDVEAAWLTPPPLGLITRLTRADFSSHSVKNHFVNALHIVVAHGERYMIANLRRVRAQLVPPHLIRQADWFIAQEAAHAKEHQRITAQLHALGYRTTWLDRLCRFFGKTLLPRCFGARLNMAITVAIEHCTATVAELVLARDLFAALPPAPRQLVAWHCYEELEHRSVAYDVFAALGGTYLERALGMIVGVGLVAGLMIVGMLSFLAQDRLLVSPRAWREGIGFFLTEEALVPALVLRSSVLLAPRFHPADRFSMTIPCAPSDTAQRSVA